MRDVIHMRGLRTEVDADEIDLPAAIFQGVQSEIDRRKGEVARQDTSDITVELWSPWSTAHSWEWTFTKG